MATKKTAAVKAEDILEGIDLVAFAKQKAEVEQKASLALAERVEKIRTILAEMKTIVSVSGVSVYIGDLITDFEDSREELDPNTDWSSSSYC